MATESRGVQSTAQHPALPAGSTQILPRTDEDTQLVYVKEPTHWFRRLLVFLGSMALLVALFFGLVLFKIIPEFHNPFTTQTTDRTGPVLLQSMKDMSKYVAAEGNFEVLVDMEVSNKYIPNPIFSTRTLFVGVGSVNAYVDFSKITDGNIVISPDGKQVTISLPAPQLDRPSLNTSQSYVYDQSKGVINHIGDLFGNSDPNDISRLYQLASDKIAQAALSSELLGKAKTNTSLMLQSLMHQLGFERVTINFPASPPSP